MYVGTSDSQQESSSQSGVSLGLHHVIHYRPAHHCEPAAIHSSAGSLALQLPAIIGGEGSTPLHIACLKGHTDTAVLLLDRGADIHSRDVNGRTPVHFACLKGHTATAVLLLDRGADIQSRDSYGLTPLHDACDEGHTATAVLLLDRGADIHSTDTNGGTPLHYACFQGHTDVAVALVRAGADTLIKNSQMKTPLDLVESEELRAALIREREKYLAWMRRKAFMMFLVGQKYIVMRRHRPVAAAAGQQPKEPLVDTVMREVNMTIASFL